MSQNAYDTDDEVPFDYDNIYKSTRWPYLKLHEKNEYDALRRTVNYIQEKKERGEDPGEMSSNDCRKVVRIFRMWRLLDSVKGFHEGSLDLSGRHESRYEALSKRWKDFVKDYNELSPVVQEVEDEVGIQMPYKTADIGRWIEMDLKMQDRKEWISFVGKWGSTDYTRLAESVDDVFKVLEKNPNPKFQQLCLVDLPVEIIDYIFSLTTMDKARLLSSTCQKLREIGRAHIFIYRTLTLDVPDSFWTNRSAAGDRGDTLENIHDALVKIIKISKSNLIKQVKFLLSRPDLMKVLGTLAIGNSARPWLRRCGVEDTLGESFYRPIIKSFKNVILNCKELREVKMSYLDLSTEILQAAVSRQELATLALYSCVIPQPVIRGILNGSIRPSSSILNLVIMDSDEPTFNTWAPVALCPNLRTLAVTAVGKNDLEPSILVSRRVNLFATLEKLFVGPVSNAGIIDLTRWIELNAEQGPLRLTHLKISAKIGIEERLIFQLLDVLESAPLQVLVLDGIKEGSLELFDRIAAKCPQLRGLTVIRRENDLQRKTKPAMWPYTSYEYAPHLSGFRKLEHFSWNFRVPVFDSTPAGIEYFEQGFISKLEYYQREMKGEVSEEDDYFRDSHYIAYPFAVHCPTLKSFAAVSGRMLDTICHINRKPDGRFELVGLDMMKSITSGVLDEWDIPLLSIHWPHVVPRYNPNLNA